MNGKNDKEREGAGGGGGRGQGMKYIPYIRVSVSGAACLSAVVVVVSPPLPVRGTAVRAYLEKRGCGVPGSTICRSLACRRVIMYIGFFKLVGRRRRRGKLSTHIAICCWWYDRSIAPFFFCSVFLSISFRLDCRLRLRHLRIEVGGARLLLETSPGYVHSAPSSRDFF